LEKRGGLRKGARTFPFGDYPALFAIPQKKGSALFRTWHTKMPQPRVSQMGQEISRCNMSNLTGALPVRKTVHGFSKRKENRSL
jgi:hypothetical protein